MKLTILGSGTGVPNGERNSAGYFIEMPEARVLLDCGAGTVHALARYGVDWQRMTHIFLSHFHVDHIGELAPLFFAFRHGLKAARTQKLTLVGPRGIRRIVDHLKEAFGEKVFTPRFPFDLMEVEPGEKLALASDSTLSVAKTPHTAESLAAKIETPDSVIGYTGDTSFSEDLARFFYQADVLLSECSFAQRQETVAHLSIAEAARMAHLAEVKRLVVTHFYFPVDEAEVKRELAETFSGDIVIGKDGLVVEW